MSAVSRELSDVRQMVANCLKVFHNVDIFYQPEFGTESGKLLSMLERRVNRSIGVVQLVGDAYGAAPHDGHPEFGQISFTQFELLYALERKKLTWLIQVQGSCTREVAAAEFVVGDPPDVSIEAARLREAYHRRLLAGEPGGLIAARPADDDELKAVIAEHNRRRQLQRDYFAGQHTHLYSIVDNDDELVERVRDLQGLPRVRAPKGFQKIGVEDALADGIVGRSPLMFDVLVLLRRPGSTRARIVMRGLGGAGKTRAAIEIGHAFHKIGHHVLMCKTLPGRPLDEAIASLAVPLRMPRAQAAGVRAWLRTHQDWLMIVDGVDEVDTADAVEQFCKEYPNGSFLITSYLHEEWADRRQFKTRDVTELAPADAHRLLRRMLAAGSRPPDQEPDTRALARQLGGLPLAIEHANGYLNSKLGEPVASYVARLERANVLPVVVPGKSGKRLKPIYVTWQTSIEQVAPSSRTLLRLLSFLTDDPIPARLIGAPEVAKVFAQACAADPLEQWPATPSLPPLSDVTGWQDEIWRAIHELLGFSLIRWDDKERTHIRAHRLVLAMTQASLRPVAADVLGTGLKFQRTLASLDLHATFLGHAIRFLTDYLAREGRSGRKQIYPHLVHLARLYLRRGADEQLQQTPLLLNPDESIFLGDVFSLMGEGHEADAAAHFARALAATDASPYVRARANQGSGWASFQEGSHGDALDYYASAEAAIDGQPDDRRNDDLRYEIHSGRGWVNRFIGRVDVALLQLKRAMELAEGSADDEALDRGDAIARLADAYICLGGAYDYAGDYDEARRCYTEAIEGADESGDPSLRGLARYMGGWFLVRQGPRDQGMTLCHQALKLGEEFGFGDVRGEAAWILAIGYALEGRFHTALAMADRAARRPGGFVAAWVRMIRGIMRFRAGLRNAATDFEKAIKSCHEDIEKFENFDPLDTRAFAHAGLAILGRERHEELAVRDYQHARKLASARGIVDIGKTVFDCFGSSPPVKRIEKRLFGAA